MVNRICISVRHLATSFHSSPTMYRRQEHLPSPLLLIVLAVTLFLKIGVLIALKNANMENPFIEDTSSEYPRTFPVGKLATVRMNIEDTVHFSLENDADWDALTPGDGLVYLGEDAQPFTPSMFHQLRCLNIIRKAVVELEASGTNETVIPSDLSYHCVNYLRQMVLCRGDLELDPVLGKPFPNVFPDSYQCKDWTQVYREVEKNQRTRQIRL